MILLAVGITGCAGEPKLPARASRWGILGDLVAYQREIERGGPFFLDRFETTWADWRIYAVAAAAEGRVVEPATPLRQDDSLPVVGVSLAEARRFAQWRFCRLPRADEWQYAATGRGVYRYPWGEVFRGEWVNSWELGVGQPTPVGTFESGRDEGGAYDLLGNVAEWTESLDPGWRGDGFRAVHPIAWRAALAVPGLRGWLRSGLPAPMSMVSGALQPKPARLVVGGHFRARLASPTAPGDRRLSSRSGGGSRWARGTGERGDTVGLRLATDPRSVLRALLREPTRPTAGDARAVRAFLARHQRMLRPALPTTLHQIGDAATGPLAHVVTEALAP
ncbi:MAG: SUMF1/EgtB/PvdO family nonheme iron enzyme [Planctomycetota bacterium]